MTPDRRQDEPGHTGLYIHIPFCKKKCRYCDFYSITDLSLRGPFINALDTEMRLASNHRIPVDTIYLGGGTPSVLDADQIRYILESCRRYFDLRPDAEITMEVNPGTINKHLIGEYRLAGVNRLSIGIQSFQARGLLFLGRMHSPDDASRALKEAKCAGFENISIDMIYGIPSTLLSDWKIDLEKAIQFQPDHLSCYMLTIEPGTPLFADLQNNLFQPVSERDACIMFEATRRILSDAGYIQYEVSNFARSPAYYSRHNMKYWTFKPYIGLGPSAHSLNANQRYWNKQSVREYINDLGRGRRPVKDKEVLSFEQQMIEALFLGFRQTTGVDIGWFNQTFDIDFQRMFASTIQALSQNGCIELSKSRCRLTPKGLRLLDSIVDAFVEAI